jgi:Arc/MetJ-type ribon-helix-helix transcriptional regulator
MLNRVLLGIEVNVCKAYNCCMDAKMMTINISLPKAMYADAKKKVADKRYASISELVRDAVRGVLYTEITENGFTREFEDKVLKSASMPIENDLIWDEVTPFTQFSQSKGKKKYVEDTQNSGVLPKRKRSAR